MIERRGELKSRKLLRVRVLHDETRLTSVEITGDFFLHPEEGLKEMESSLCGLPLPIREEAILRRLDDTVKRNDLILIGFSTVELSRLIAEVLG